MTKIRKETKVVAGIAAEKLDVAMQKFKELQQILGQVIQDLKTLREREQDLAIQQEIDFVLDNVENVILMDTKQNIDHIERLIKRITFGLDREINLKSMEWGEMEKKLYIMKKYGAK